MSGPDFGGFKSQELSREAFYFQLILRSKECPQRLSLKDQAMLITPSEGDVSRVTGEKHSSLINSEITNHNVNRRNSHKIIIEFS